MNISKPINNKEIHVAISERQPSRAHENKKTKIGLLKFMNAASPREVHTTSTAVKFLHTTVKEK